MVVWVPAVAAVVAAVIAAWVAVWLSNRNRHEQVVDRSERADVDEAHYILDSWKDLNAQNAVRLTDVEKRLDACLENETESLKDRLELRARVEVAEQKLRQAGLSLTD